MHKPATCFIALALLLAAGCASAPVPPTLTPSPTATPSPTPTATATTTATPSVTETPAPTITAVVPSSFGGSPLHARIAYTDAALCEGSVPREFALSAERTDALDVRLACLKQMLKWEDDAAQQQQKLHTRGTCYTQPATGTISQRGIRINEIWALDDIASGYIFAARALADNQENAMATEPYQTVIDYYSCGWMYDLDNQMYYSALEQAEAGLAALEG